MPRRRREPVPQQGAFCFTLPPGTEIVVLDPNEIPVSNAWLYPLLGNEPSDEGIIVGPGTDNDMNLTFANPTTICKIMLNGELNDVTITSTRPDGSVTILVVEVRHRGVWVSDLFKPEQVVGIRITANERSKITQIQLSRAVTPVPLSEARVSRMIVQGTTSHDGEYTFADPPTVRNALETVRVGLYSNLDEAYRQVQPVLSAPASPAQSPDPDIRYINEEDVSWNNAYAPNGQLFFPRESFVNAEGLSDCQMFQIIFNRNHPNPVRRLSCRLQSPLDIARITIPFRTSMRLKEFNLIGNFESLQVHAIIDDFGDTDVTLYDSSVNTTPSTIIRAFRGLFPSNLIKKIVIESGHNFDIDRLDIAYVPGHNAHIHGNDVVEMMPNPLLQIQSQLNRLSDDMNRTFREMARNITNSACHETEEEEEPDDDGDGNDDAVVSESDSVRALRAGEARRRVRAAVEHNAPLDANLFTDPISRNVYRREFRTIDIENVVENCLGIQSVCARYDLPAGIGFAFEPSQQPLMRIFPAHDTTPPDGWEGRMKIKISVYDACMAVRRGIIYEGHYEDFLKPQCPEDNHYHPQVARVQAFSGDRISVGIESPDVVIDPTLTRFRLQSWLLTILRKRRVYK